MTAEPTDPLIRPMRRSDIAAVVAIERQVRDRPWSAGLFASELAQPGRCYLTAWADGGHPRLLGYGGVLLAVDEAHITNVAVDPQARRRKVGSHLMHALLDSALSMGATAATLEVGAGNHAAQRLYAVFGFAPVGVRPGYYEATGEDAIIMWAYDLGGPDARARRRRLQTRKHGGAQAVDTRTDSDADVDRQVVG